MVTVAVSWKRRESRNRAGETMSETREDLLVRISRDRARAYAKLSDAHGQIQDLQTELHNTRLDLAAAKQLLAYHGFEVVES